MNQFRMNEEFAEEASTLRFPQFMLETIPSLFSESLRNTGAGTFGGRVFSAG
ncbi:hypothetical protein [Anaeromassilibacillus sp. SJQ-1]|uniref:hypothetical protein n=1 Tax=Anaeromassilibacillus sp. SJQ-1 TaxID=3375419 RepID=UPI003988BC87